MINQIDLVESIARMDQQKRDDFITSLVDKWPNLASDISRHIDFSLQDKDLQCGKSGVKQ